MEDVESVPEPTETEDDIPAESDELGDRGSGDSDAVFQDRSVRG